MSDKQTDKEWKSDWMDSGVINYLVWSTPGLSTDTGLVWLKQALPAVHISNNPLSREA